MNDAAQECLRIPVGAVADRLANSTYLRDMKFMSLKNLAAKDL
jgi:hypothetical protein